MSFQVYKIQSFKSDVPADAAFAVLDADFPDAAVCSVTKKGDEAYATDSAGFRYPVLGLGATAGEAMEDFFGFDC